MAAKTVTFESKYAAYALVRVPKAQIPIPNGTGWQTTERGKTYQFQPVPSPRSESGFVGVLEVKVGQDKLATDSEDWLKPGAEFGVERDVVDAFMAHREFGQDFWIQGHAPGTVYPRPVEFRRDVTLATANLADDKLAEMIAEERKTHGRQELIDEASDALTVVNEILAATKAEAAAAAKAKPKAAAAAKAKPKAAAAA